MPNSTRINSAIKTIACPCCRFLWRGLVGVFGTVNRICRDDDVVADYLLNDGCDRLERVPERHLDRLVADRGDLVQTSGTRSRIAAASAPRVVRISSATVARVRDEKPPRVGARQLRRSKRVSAVGQRTVWTSRVVGEV